MQSTDHVIMMMLQAVSEINNEQVARGSVRRNRKSFKMVSHGCQDSGVSKLVICLDILELSTVLREIVQCPEKASIYQGLLLKSRDFLRAL